MGKSVSDDEKNKTAWDSNAITPGTPFMDLLANSLRYWVALKMNQDPGWKNVCLTFRIAAPAPLPRPFNESLMVIGHSSRLLFPTPASPGKENTRSWTSSDANEAILAMTRTHTMSFTAWYVLYAVLHLRPLIMLSGR